MKKMIGMLAVVLMLMLVACTKESDIKKTDADARTTVEGKETDAETETGSGESEDSDYLDEIDTMSEGAQEIIKLFMTCPNPDLYHSDMFYAIGEGVETTEEEKENAAAAQEEARKKWEEAVGEYFDSKGLDSFLRGPAHYYFIQQKEVEVLGMELIKRTKSMEEIKVTVAVDGAEEEATVTFRRNPNGLIWMVDMTND